MSEVFPDLGESRRVISVVACRTGYQAMIEEKISVTFHPHFIWVTRIARGRTVCQAVKNAMTGTKKTNRKTDIDPCYIETQTLEMSA